MSQERKLSGIVLNAEKLQEYAIITKPESNIKLEVAGNVGEANYYDPASRGESGTPRYIVSLKAMTADAAQKVVQMLEEAPNGELPIEDFNGLFLAGSIWDNDGTLSTELPMRGSFVHCNIGYVASREGEEVLRITNLQTPKAKTASITFGAFASKSEVVEEHSDVVEDQD